MESLEHSPAIAHADALDAQGAHDAAIEALALAAQRGDIEATTRLAKRIIVGDRAPRLRVQGVGLLADAVKMGGAEAAARLAVIRVTGVDAPPDWPAALRLLALAAERGWAPARAELGVLASMLDDMPAGSTGDVAPLLENTNLRKLLNPPRGSITHDDPRICLFPNFVSGPVCDWLIERSRGKLERARVYDSRQRVDFVDESRTNSAAMFNVVETDLVHMLVQARMSVGCGQPMSHMEASTVLHYATGESIGNHYDFVDPGVAGYAEEIRRFGNRVITFLVYLNSDYEGGETAFPRLGISHSGRRGEGLFFVNTLENGQADLRTLHSGRAPTRGEKWVVSQFIRNRSELTSGPPP